MTPDQYHAFTDTLLANLSADARVLGLVSAGSMAGTRHQPDEWSDHDFWVITEPGAQEHFRAVYDWLPDAAQIVYALRETEHGLKILYANGHMVEYAVFAPEELAVTKINAYKILLDRERIAERMNAVRAATVAWSAERTADDAFLFGQFLTNLWVGVGRHARGEVLSGHNFVKNHALGHLLPLLVKYADAAHPDALDDIDPFRRFALAFPDLGPQAQRALLLETPQAASTLLDLADTILRDRLPDYPAAAVEAARAHIRRAG